MSSLWQINLNIDKELTFTPSFNYGGGVDSSERLLFDYNQVISGGNLKFDLSVDRNFEIHLNIIIFRKFNFN